MKIVSFIPIKLNNQRLPGKNLLPLHGTPLCSYLFSTMEKVDNIDEKYVYCSSESIQQYLTPSLKFLKRNALLDGFDIKGLEIIDRFVHDVDADIYVLSHVTNPFVKADSLCKAIEIVKQGTYDSAFSAQKIQRYCWYRGKPINYTMSDIVTTQKLEPIYIETGGFFIFTKEVFTKHKQRIGLNPYVFEVDEIESLDIDTAEDFSMAEYILSATPKTGGK